MRYRLRTLLTVLAVGPPLIAALWFDFAVVAIIGCYFAGMALLFPAASYLARHGVDRRSRPAPSGERLR